LMPGYPEEITEIENAVKNGTLPEEDLDRNVSHILSVAARTISNKGYQFSNKPDLESHATLAREVAREGIVLLKNQAVLPLEAGKKVALLGVASYDTQPGGSGSGYVYRKYTVTIADGLEKAGYILDAGLKEAYNQHIAKVKSQLPAETSWAVPTVPEMSPSKDVIKGLASQADVAVISLGRMAGEGGDRTYSEGDFLLTKEEKQLLELTAAAFHAKGKKVVVVLNMGSSIEMDGWQDSADALLMAWMPGQEGGNAVADILSGSVSPSGRLPITLARKYEDIPASRNFGVSPGEVNAVRYEEDLMVGYRYFASSDVKPAYAFGYGLSYTTFSIDGFEVKKAADGGVDVEAIVRNTGKADGKEVLQIYVRKPGDDRPAMELCGFVKTPVIAASASLEVKLHISPDNLSQYVEASDQLECVPGQYKFYAAAASDDIRDTKVIEL
ncbi:MAG: glycoside hydrolase family 3 C-terminal domain-containing protein, partial [Bacteroidales bacterium]|nr:glycoside hydrolase family 3 C-terminal domain-containing protein [Bacteroidales bacterium]